MKKMTDTLFGYKMSGQIVDRSIEEWGECGKEAAKWLKTLMEQNDEEQEGKEERD